ncbi:MAG TPA: NAD-dependent epimerase/dehydratase family protein [Devosiaceae bacterium]|jgi:dihydroflavonol-4-reductase|nr:NAD-dependent epimerase/dehydratase family protein [Devosiaceae bacterium]
MLERVLVTGISGFLGSHVALRLLADGHVVRGSVRAGSQAERVRGMLARHGGDTSRLEIVILDLLDDAGWPAAMADVDYLQHVASPLAIEAPADRDMLIRPAVEGTRRALEAALAAGVRRVVLTSSVAAVTYGHPRERTTIFTEADWSAVAGGDVTPYSEGKTRAELEAWAVMEAAGRRDDLVVVNPAVILGPLLDDDPGISAQLVLRLFDGSVPALAGFHFGIVDVRDVAALQVRAMQQPRAGGHRYLASAGSRSLPDLAAALRDAYPEQAGRIPRLRLPDWLVRLYAMADPRVRAHIRSLGLRRELDCRPAEDLLGRPFITPRVAAAATARSLFDHGLLPDAATGREAEKRG